MPITTTQEYYQAMIHLEAEERTHSINISDYPYMKENDRSKVFKSYSNQVYNKKVHTSDELEELLKIKGIL